MTSVAVAAGIALALGGALGGRAPARTRLGAVHIRPAGAGTGAGTGAGAARAGTAEVGPSAAVARWRSALACAVGALAVAALVGGPVGLLAGAVLAGAGPALLGRLESSADRAVRRRMTAELPVAVELLVAVVVAGATLERGLLAVDEALGGPAGEVFGSVGALLAAGAEARVAWSAWFDDPSLGRLARAAVRADVSGSPPAAVLARVAVDLRARSRVDAEASARRVAVLAVAPLGLCFLPAFVLLGVLPVVAGLASAAFAPGS